ncbi:Pleiotropic drug resistance ABC transporter protein [Mycena sanguinolenta]|uniref:Pleiotropic drug resistance ABC transporter protein n=1 Tax=Mycena sanguinolenta TaxID=230812 RepID=A0A8H7DKB8_9AGAR|nr:Pleiotropic drug resistance ABC transporter protein [Mycena sanguinolenta]
MHGSVGESSSIGIYGGTGGNGGNGDGQGGGGGVGLGPSIGGMHVVIQNPSSDNVHQWPTNPAPARSLSKPRRASSRLYPSGMEARPMDISPPNTSSTSAPVYSESETYCSELLRQGRGFPLFVPEPQLNLPAEWRMRGVAIGDVGRISPAGSFDFFFNIYLPASHPINAKVPEDFVPLSPYDPSDVGLNDLSPGNYVCSRRTVTRTEVDGKFQEFPGGGFDFSCREPSGAVLTLPHGAHLEKLENLARMERYAAEHAESWYKYANVKRGRGLVNGRLYLITGWEKAPSWGIAYFHDVSLRNEFKLSFGPTADAANGYKYRWNGSHCHYKQADSPLDDGTPLNHTTFVHAFAISVGERVWEKLFGNGLGICQPLDWSTVRKNSGRSLVPYSSQGSSFPWSIFTGGSAQNNVDRSFVPQGPSFPWSFFTEGSVYNGGRQATAAAPGDGIVADAFPILQIMHPSQIIHQRILRQAPQATVVITHDDAWRDVFKEDGMRMLGQTASELQQAIFDRFDILEEDGAVFLRAKPNPTTTRNAATITAVRGSCNRPSDGNTGRGGFAPNQPQAPLSCGTQYRASNTQLQEYHQSGSFFNGSRDFGVSGGEFYNLQSNMNIVSEGTSYTMNGSYKRQSNANTEGRGGFAPNPYQAPPNPQYGNPNAQFPGYGQSASNAVLAEYPQRQADQRPIFPPAQPAYSAPPQPYPRRKRDPAQLRPASMEIPAPLQSNSREMSYPRDNFSSSSEEAEPSSWSSRRSSMSEFPQTWKNDWSPQSPPNRSQFAPPPLANSSYRGSQFAPPAPASSSYRVRPRVHERRRGEARRFSSGSDSEDPDPLVSAPPPRPHPHRTPSQMVSPSPTSSLWRYISLVDLAGLLPAPQHIHSSPTISTDEPVFTSGTLATSIPSGEYIVTTSATTSNIKSSAPVSASEHIL